MSRKTKTTTDCIVVWDDGQGLCVPMTEDPSCQGALQAAGAARTVAVFGGLVEARKAIRISILWNALLKEQGRPHIADFDADQRKYLHVLRLVVQGS